MQKNEKHMLTKTYTTAMFMLALLDEWSRVERIGITAKIYNRLIQKHNNFHRQIYDVKKGRKGKYSQKCELFVEASAYAISVWDKVMKDTKDSTISANIVIHNLYRLNAQNFSKVYGLYEEDFLKLNSQACGVTLASCRVARLLLEGVEDVLKSAKEDKSI